MLYVGQAGDARGCCQRGSRWRRMQTSLAVRASGFGRLVVVIDQQHQFEQSVLPHLDAAYNLARWLSRSPADAEDIVQEALLLAFRGFDQWRGAGAKAWLLTIVRNCHYSAARRAASEVRLTESLDDYRAITPAALLSTDDLEQSSIAAEIIGVVDAALRSLPHDFREVLVLREMEGLSYKEIAMVVGLPIGTVMSRLARARELLKRQWRQDHGGSGDDLP